MLCCLCKKGQATYVYQKKIDGVSRSEYYCSECYHRLFVLEKKPVEKNYDGNSCPYCGTTVDDFIKTQLVGCEMCYKTLAKVVIPAIMKMQGIGEHIGKKPTEVYERSEEEWKVR